MKAVKLATIRRRTDVRIHSVRQQSTGRIVVFRFSQTPSGNDGPRGSSDDLCKMHQSPLGGAGRHPVTTI
jgi:hypothetical protein